VNQEISRREVLMAAASCAASLVPAPSHAVSAQTTSRPPGFPLKVGPVQAGPGEVRWGRVPVRALSDGTAAELPIILVNGRQPGPILGLFACMYGTGYEQGIDVVCRLTREVVDPAKLPGGIIASPLINPMAFNSRTTHSVEDQVDMQMAFPGDPQGSITQRVVHFLHEEGIRQCNAVINFHAKAQIDWSVVMTHDNAEVRRQSMILAEAYGTPIFEMSHTRYPKFLVVSAMNLGIPAFLSEPVWPPSKGPGPGTSIRGILNVMKHLSMLDGKIEPQTENLVPPGRYIRRHMYGRQPGLIRPLKDPGDPVQKDETIAYVHDILGDQVEEIKSPADGYLRIWTTRRVVAGGAQAGEIFALP